MPTIVHGFDWPDRLIVGTVGHPGSRSFYLQAKDGRRVVSVALEKEQSAVLAEKIDEILDDLMAHEGNPFSVPSGTPVELVDNEPLEQPVDSQFRTGAMTLGWDVTTSQVVIEAYPVDDSDDDVDEIDAETEPAEMMQVRIPVGTARAFAKRTLEIVGAGRPLCPLCGQPMDPEGHVCVEPGDF
ncbi:putative repeat protein (TIGR03847 family) [Frondihabitans sp. PhB188]|uniref:DUF3090 domain-containing protein n=1 Tax=Frondihabitans sp. PhB188 TaxID=2485200 RepID=UPI000F478B76|nr:DUF3090 domain-containing protein [Frondihabitans sp. PhB188]ROQ39810.1 putative repeat protein (TIGR03847 family) [Frondihabitans sp. PhB188]